MAINRFWRRSMVTAPRRRRSAPLLPETAGLSGTARRVNRVVAVVALFGAFGTVALAVALTPGAQTAASSAPAPLEAVTISKPETISRAEVPPVPAPVAAASLNMTIVAVQPPPEPAPKADRLFRANQAPEDSGAQSPASVASDTGEAGERDFALADGAEPPTAARVAADSAGRKLDEFARREREFGLSEPPPPGEGRVAAAEDIAAEDSESAVEGDTDEAVDTAVEEEIDEVVEEAVEEAIEETAPVEEAAPQVAATRTVPVTTDVNMRARPSNGSAVIQVVPGKSTVEVISCDYWCEVVYEGKRGWIYKGFVRGS